GARPRGRGRTGGAGLQPFEPIRDRRGRPRLREDRVREHGLSQLPRVPPNRDRAGHADPCSRGRTGARVPARLLARVREGRVRRMRRRMKASLPRRMTLPAIEAAVITLGYGPKRETFDLVAFKALHNGKRFHMRLETHGLDRVPKGSEIDLHTGFFREVKGFHGSEAESEEIAFEMAQLLGALKSGSEEQTSVLQSRENLVWRLLLA